MEPNRGLFTFLLLIVSAVTAITANYSGASKLAACIAIGGGTTIAAYAFYSAYRLRQVLDERQRNESIDLALSLAAGLLGCFMAGAWLSVCWVSMSNPLSFSWEPHRL